MNAQGILFTFGFVVFYGIVTLGLIRCYWSRISKNPEIHSSIVIPIKFLVLEFVVLSLIFGFEDVALYIILDAGGHLIDFDTFSSFADRFVWNLFFVIPWLFSLLAFYLFSGKIIADNIKGNAFRAIITMIVLFVIVPVLIFFGFFPIQLMLKEHYTPLIPYLLEIPDVFGFFWDFVNSMAYLSIIILGNLIAFVLSFPFFLYFIFKNNTGVHI